MKSTINLTITTNDIINSLRKIIINSDNKEDFVLLFSHLITDSYMGPTYFIKLMLGDNLPKLPKVGDQGYTLIDSLGYGHDKEKYKNSKFCQQGYIPCTISKINSIAAYNPLQVILPDIGQPDKETRIDINQFYIDDLGDVYDNLPI
jgi:hypothetical protein